MGFLLKHADMQVETSPRTEACVDGGALCSASGITEQEELWLSLVSIVSFWLPLWSSCSACRSLLPPLRAPTSLHVPFKECRGQALTLGCHLVPCHRESGLCVSYGYLRHLGDLALFLPPSCSCVSFTITEFTVTTTFFFFD